MPITININNLVDKVEVNVHPPQKEGEKPVYTYNHAELMQSIHETVLLAFNQAVDESLADKLKQLD